MPELPEVETVKRGLAPALEGHRLVRVETRRANLRWPFPVDFVQALTGARVAKLDRRSKYLLIYLETGRVLIAHLGMSGRFRIHETSPPPPGKHDHVVFETDQGVVIYYHDPRRFGSMDLVDADALDAHPLIKALGPEPLSDHFNAQSLAASLKGRKTTIKAALMDQRTVAGLGNIYVCEALFRAGLSPKRQALTVQGGRAAKVVGAIKEILAEAIRSGGSSLRDHLQVNGELGYFQHAFAVYGREGEACQGCDCDVAHSGGVRRIVQGGRSTFYCAKRQR